MTNNFMWSYLLHLGFNMWAEKEPGIHMEGKVEATDYLRCEKPAWDELILALKENGCNNIVIDLGEGVKYESHPELAIKGSWEKQMLADEISKLKDMGFEVIPKLNFSTGHDEWLGIYSRMVSTPEYYKVCDDLIDEVSELFGNPRLFHLGMDEEVYSIQTRFAYCVIREGDLYWNDQNKLFKRCEKNGARPWIWSDYVWHRPDREKLFLEKMSKDVLLNTWYYGEFEETGDWREASWRAYKLLDDHGFSQVPAASNFESKNNPVLLSKYMKENLSQDLIEGYMMTTWLPTTEKCRDRNLEGIQLLSEAKKEYYK